MHVEIDFEDDYDKADPIKIDFGDEYDKADAIDDVDLNKSITELNQ